MATYDELLLAAGNTNLLNKVRVATFVAATTIMVENVAVTNHVNRLLWAKSVFNDPTSAGLKMMWPVLAQNKTATLTQITGATDATVQSAVDAAVDVFANGL